MKRNWNTLVGCSGWFESDGYFTLVPDLKLYRADGDNNSPLFIVYAKKGKNLIISSGGAWMHTFPVNRVRVLEAK
jgi:hypothetical protein